jgi:hypothetical protein
MASMDLRVALPIAQSLLVLGRRDDDLGEIGEGDDPHPRPRRQLIDEGQGRLLRHRQPIGVDVGGAHASRDVQRQDDRGAAERDFDLGHRARHRQAQAGQSAHVEREGEMAAPPSAFRQRLADEGQAGIAHGQAPFPSQHPEVDRHDRGREEQQGQRPRPEDRHRRPPTVRLEMPTEPRDPSDRFTACVQTRPAPSLRRPGGPAGCRRRRGT